MLNNLIAALLATALSLACMALLTTGTVILMAFQLGQTVMQACNAIRKPRLRISSQQSKRNKPRLTLVQSSKD
jgi:Spy/CpxP family protein refolding chaperone